MRSNWNGHRYSDDRQRGRADDPGLERRHPRLDAAPATPSTRAAGSVQLTEREKQVLRLIVQGAQNKEIAAQLNITERTVKAHLASIFNRLGVNSRTEAAAAAVRMGLEPDE